MAIDFTSEGVIPSPMQVWLLLRYWPHKTRSRKCVNITVTDRVRNAWIPNRKSRVLPTQKHGQSLIVHKKVIIYDNLLLVIIGSGDVFHLLYSPTQPPKKNSVCSPPLCCSGGAAADWSPGTWRPLSGSGIRGIGGSVFFDEEITQPGYD